MSARGGLVDPVDRMTDACENIAFPQLLISLTPRKKMETYPVLQLFSSRNSSRLINLNCEWTLIPLN